MQDIPKRIEIFNVPIDILSYKSALKRLFEIALSDNPCFVFTPNVHHIYLVNKSPKFKEAYQNCSLSLVDGTPIIWALRYLFGIRTDKISGSDMFTSLFKRAYDKGLKIFLLGGKQGIAQQAAENLRKNSSKSATIACLSPPLGFELDLVANLHVIQTINKFNPNILFVALGSPKGELWIHQNFKHYKANLAIGVGGSIDFAAGLQKRAPRWMQKIGFEWFFRLCNDPKRLFNRYFTSNSFFVWMAVKEIVKRFNFSNYSRS